MDYHILFRAHIWTGLTTERNFTLGYKQIVLNDLFLFKEYQNPIMDLA